MASWQDVTDSAAEFAAAVQARFDVQKHKTLATLRKDGSPRISGIEVTFAQGDLWFGMMPGSRKAQDLQRDPRLAVHSPSLDADETDPSSWGGDAKVSGLAVEITDRDRAAAVFGAEIGDGHAFRVDIREVVLTRVGDPADHLLIELWQDGQELQRFIRK